MSYSAARGSRRALLAALAVVGITLGGLGWFVASLFDPDNLKPKLIAAVRQATGRTMTVSGPIGIKMSLVPTIVLNDVALSNPPGFSRPDMMTIRRVEMTLALSPLLERRVEIGHVALSRPEIQLEKTREGLGNWVIQRDASPGGLTGPEAGIGAKPAGPGDGRYAVSVADIRIEDGRVTWMDIATGKLVSAGIPNMTVNVPDAAPMTAHGTAEISGRPVAFDLKTGAIDRLRTASDAAPWPVSLRLAAGDAVATLEGRVDRPLQGRGYAFDIDASIPDPAVLAPQFPGAPLAAMKMVTAHAEIRDGGTRMPVIPVLRIRIGTADLSRFAAGARLEDLTLTAADDEPMKIAARFAMPGFDGGLAGTIGNLSWLGNGASGPLDVDLEGSASSARATLKGRIQAPLKFSDYGLDVTVNVPNPALLMDSAPQALKAVDLRTRLTDASGPVAFRLTSNAGDLAGDMEVSLRPRLSIVGHVTSNRLDMDILRSGPSVDGPVSQVRVPDGQPQEGRAIPGRPTGTPVPRPAAVPVFPSTRLPFDLLAQFDADLTLRFGMVRLGGTEIAGIDTVLSAKDGISRLAPFTVAAPDLRLSGSLEIDNANGPPRVHLVVHAPALAVRPFLTMIGLPPALTAAADVQADLTGTGHSQREIAASLGGWAGVAVKDGQLDAKIVNGWLDQLRPLRFEGGDTTDLRCFAVRLDAKNGIATVQPMALNTPALIVDGGGEVDLGRETVSLRIRPRTRIGGMGVAVPVRVSGPLRGPRAKVDLSSTNAGGAAGLLLGGKDIMGAAGGGDPCPVALARARNETPPEETSVPAREVPDARRGAPVGAADVLRSWLARPEGKK
ncbi:MAG: AsmA family protein [Acetobacteraceae bacterium]|nr:AsmA family protein [Acetobacteraceae bacterium]